MTSAIPVLPSWSIKYCSLSVLGGHTEDREGTDPGNFCVMSSLEWEGFLWLKY
jgi:hypothetical protein